MNQERIQSPEKVTFKKVLPEDWEKFRAIRLKGLQTDPQAFGGTFESESQEDEEAWKKRFVNPERHYYAAQENDAFVATAGSRKISDDTWMVIAVYTLPEFRGKGLSQELIDQVIAESINSGAKKITLMVNTEQEGAVNLYKKMGFEITGTEKDLKMGDGLLHDEYHMEKNFSSSAQ